MSIKICLDNYQNVCYPGQTISGRVECDFDQEEKLRAIRIHFKGAAKTKWSESRGSGKSRSTTHFHGEETYFNHEYYLLEGNENFTLPAGKHIYPFAYILPVPIPSSCELDYGHIHHKITATVDRPWKFDYDSEFYLIVVSPLDLNYLPILREVRSFSGDKEVGCCCFQSGPVNLNVSMPISGFVPGQEVNIGCYVQNLSNSSVTEVRYKIKAMFEFIAQEPRRKSKFSEDTTLLHVDGGIGAHGEKSWTTNFKIPQNQFVNITNCGIINFAYKLEIEVVLPLPHTNLNVEMPITIGSTPLVGIDTAVPGPPRSFAPDYPQSYQMPPVLNPSAPVIQEASAPYLYEPRAPLASSENGLPSYNEVSEGKL